MLYQYHHGTKKKAGILCHNVYGRGGVCVCVGGVEAGKQKSTDSSIILSSLDFYVFVEESGLVIS